MVHAYILIQTEVGKAAQVASAISEIAGVPKAEDVTGPYDVIVRAEAIPHVALLTVDGQRAVELQVGDEIHSQRSRHTVNLVRLAEGGFFDALRNKLSWGER